MTALLADVDTSRSPAWPRLGYFTEIDSVRLALGKYGARNACTGSAAIGGHFYPNQLCARSASAKAGPT
jgi:hypothetical protein